MKVPVFTAVTGASWEVDLVSVLDRSDLGVAVARRCVDLADLLAAAATGTARAVLLSADLRRLDRDALARLAAAGLAVVGLVPPGGDEAARRLRLLGVTTVLPADTPAADIAAAVLEAVEARRDGGGYDYADPTAALPERGSPVTGTTTPGAPVPLGRLVAVWGPTGAPGRTTVAVGVASEVAAAGAPVLLADADVYGGAIGQLLGLLDEAPGLAAAARLANQGTLDVASLAGVARAVTPLLRVLTGISRADRWPELRPSALELVLAQCRRLADLTVVDCGFCLEQDEELSYDTAAPRRNGATLAALAAADTVVAVGSGDPVGLQRLVRGLGELREALPGVDPVVVVNRLRRTAVRAGDAETDIAAALARHAGVDRPWFVPLDVAGVDAAVAAGRTLTEAAPRSPARLALQQLAASLTGRAPADRSRWARRGVTAAARRHRA